MTAPRVQQVFATADRKSVWLLAAFGLAIRVVMIFHAGYGRDIALFESWAAKGATFGVTRLYDPGVGNVVSDYPPLMLYVYTSVGYLVQAVQHDFVHGERFVAALKLPSIIVDAAIAGYLVWLGSNIGKRNAGLIAGGLFFILPAAWLDSAMWGQVDVIYSGLLLIAFASIPSISLSWPALRPVSRSRRNFK